MFVRAFYYLIFTISTNKCTHIFVYHNYITNAPTCFAASAPSSGSFDIVFVKVIKLLKLYKTVDRCVVKCVLLVECDGGCITIQRSVMN